MLVYGDSYLFLNCLENIHFVGSDHADSLALHSISGCSSYAMDVIGYCSWQVVVDDQIDLRNIQPSGGEVSSH